MPEHDEEWKGNEHVVAADIQARAIRYLAEAVEHLAYEIDSLRAEIWATKNKTEGDG